MTKVTVVSRLWESFQIGPHRINGRSDIGRIPAERVVSGGYVTTPDVDEADWNAWHTANIGHPAIKDGRLYAEAQAVTDEGAGASRKRPAKAS